MIFKSVFTSVEIPDTTVHDLILGQCKLFADRIALVDGVTGLCETYAELSLTVRRLANGYYRLGLRKGDVISICSPNSIEYAHVYLAGLVAGATVTVTNYLYTKDEIKWQLEDSGASWIYADHTVATKVRDAARHCAKIKGLITNGTVEGFADYYKLKVDDVINYPNLKFYPKEDLAVIIYSSGTTGRPKGVMLSHYNIVANIIQYTHPGFQGSDTTPAMQPCMLLVLPLFHTYGLVAVLTRGLYRGTKLVVIPRFEPNLFLTSIEKYKINFLSLVPALVIFLMKSPLVAKYDLSSLQTVSCGAAPLQKEMEMAFKTKFGLQEIRQGYGMTEATCTLARTLKGQPLGCVGFITPNTEAKVVDPDSGHLQSYNEEGEICIRGPNVMKGYLNNPAPTKEAIDSDGFLHTGDAGYFDKDNLLYVVDRLKEIIKYKGFQVSPTEIEDRLLLHPHVAEVSVVGLPDDEAGEIPKAFVVRKPGSDVTESELMRFAEEGLAPIKRLRGGVEFLCNIPKTATGKIMRRELIRRPKKSKI